MWRVWDKVFSEKNFVDKIKQYIIERWLKGGRSESALLRGKRKTRMIRKKCFKRVRTNYYIIYGGNYIWKKICTSTKCVFMMKTK